MSKYLPLTLLDGDRQTSYKYYKLLHRTMETFIIICVRDHTSTIDKNWNPHTVSLHKIINVGTQYLQPSPSNKKTESQTRTLPKKNDTGVVINKIVRQRQDKTRLQHEVRWRSYDYEDIILSHLSRKSKNVSTRYWKSSEIFNTAANCRKYHRPIQIIKAILHADKRKEERRDALATCFYFHVLVAS